MPLCYIYNFYRIKKSLARLTYCAGRYRSSPSLLYNTHLLRINIFCKSVCHTFDLAEGRYVLSKDI